MFSPQTVKLKPSRQLFILWCCLYGALVAATAWLPMALLFKVIIYTVIFFVAIYDFRHRVLMTSKRSVQEVGFDSSDAMVVSLKADAVSTSFKQFLLERISLPQHKGWWIRSKSRSHKQFIKLLNGTTCWKGLIVLVYGRWPHQCVVITRDSVASDDDFRRLKALMRLES